MILDMYMWYVYTFHQYVLLQQIAYATMRTTKW